MVDRRPVPLEATAGTPVPRRSTRREALRAGVVALAGAAVSASGREVWAALAEGGDADRPQPALRVGLVSDIHYAERPTSGSRHYRDALGKLWTAVDRLQAAGAELLVEVGDLVDEGRSVAEERGFVEAADAVLARFSGERFFVPGNHCIWTLTKPEFYGHCGDREPRAEGHLSFDRKGFHFVILDACYRADGTPYGRKNNRWTDTEIPEAQRRWLARDLEKAPGKTVVFVHQRLDVGGNYGVASAAKVRSILEASGKVVAVIQGHNHVNDLKWVGGIPYVTLQALIDGPGSDPKQTAYGVLELHEGGALRIEGFARQVDQPLARQA